VTSTPVVSAAGQLTFDSLDPRTGEVVGTHPVHSESDVRAAVRRAEEAARWWRGLGFSGRRTRLLEWRKALATRLDEIAGVITAETGKPLDDARLELVLAIDHVDWAAKHAQKTLGRRKVPAGMLGGNQAATLGYAPIGVVGVIGPWNYPVFTPMGSIAYALAAGNAVVFKPSELTPGVGEILAATLHDAVPEQALIQVVTGFGVTGAALCRAPGVGKIAFTGSTATGKRVMAACAENLTPVLIECGGKDALIVDAGADLEAAADAAVWGGMSNAGQTCVGVERVYVVESAADEFTAQVVATARDRAQARGRRPRARRASGGRWGGLDQAAFRGARGHPGRPRGLLRGHRGDLRAGDRREPGRRRRGGGPAGQRDRVRAGRVRLLRVVLGR
jgi:acyl-CoA reductase-like NAD-dependent aldehyde dehydrogenase